MKREQCTVSEWDGKLRKYRTLNFSMRKRPNFDYADKAADCILTHSMICLSTQATIERVQSMFHGNIIK